MSASDRAEGEGESRVESADGDETDPRADLSRRQWLGVATLVAGLVLLVAADAHPLLKSDNRLLLVGVATVTLILGLFAATDRRITTGRAWSPPDPEPGTHVPIPGESFERLADRDLRARIRTRALVSLCDATDCSRTAAEERLADGTWTADPLAAAFLGDELDPPRRHRWWARLTGADLEARGRERAMAELAAIRAADRTAEPAATVAARSEPDGERDRAEGSRV